MSAFRLNNGNMEAAVQRYEHPDGRTILMAGCPHLGEPDFYANLRKVIDKAEERGAVVHVEGMTGRGGELEALTRNDEEIAAMRAQDQGLTAQFQEMADLFGLPWVYQHNSAMAEAPTWRHLDVDQLSMVRLMGFRLAAATTPLAAPSELEWLRTADKGSTRYLVKRKMFIHSYMNTARHKPPLLNRIAAFVMRRKVRAIRQQQVPMKIAVFTYRECVAALQALKADAKHLVLVWHPEHFPGICVILGGNGFEHKETQWLTVVHKIRVSE